MFGVVRFISTLQLRLVWGHASLENLWNLEAKRLPLRPLLGQCDVLRRPDRSLISQATPFADEACETIIIHLEEWKGVGRVMSHCLQPSRKLQHMSPACLRALCGCSLSNDANWRRETKQATGEGKSGPVETGLT